MNGMVTRGTCLEKYTTNLKPRIDSWVHGRIRVVRLSVRKVSLNSSHVLERMLL